MMRASLLVVAIPIAVSVAGLFACMPLDTGSSSGGVSTLEAGTGDAALRADSAVAGGGCGTEQQSGSELCVATSLCPTWSSIPRPSRTVASASVEPRSISSAPAVAPSARWASSRLRRGRRLLANQTSQGVCVQVAEGRCSESAAGTTSSSSSSASSSSSSGSSPCDRRCLTECGGGAACASVCNC